MRYRIPLVIVLLTALCVPPCFGWGRDGHTIIGDIATAYLTEKTKAAIKELLGDQSLADVSNWADELRDDPEFEWTKPLHYINVPRGSTRVSLARDCPDQRCVVAAVRTYEHVLRNAEATREQRIEALKFLVHFIGDVHQPMHVSYEDDRGGNQVNVTWRGDDTWNLHSVWDTAMLRHRIANDRQRATRDIQQSITDRQIRRWRQSKDPVAWANESLALTSRVYQQLPRNRQLDDEYYRRNISTVEERLAAAGVRLAAMLNSIFDEGQESARPVGS